MAEVPTNCGCGKCDDDRPAEGVVFCAVSDDRPIIVYTIYDCDTNTFVHQYWDVGAGAFIPNEPLVRCDDIAQVTCDDNRDSQGDLFCAVSDNRPIILYSTFNCETDQIDHLYWDVGAGIYIPPEPVIRCEDIGSLNEFGNGFVWFNELTPQCTNDKINWTQYLTVDTPDLAPGLYRWGLYFEHSQDNASKSMDWRLQIDGVTITSDDASTDDNQIARYEILSKFGYTTVLTPGVKTIDLDFKLTNLTGTFQACMRDARLEWWRAD
jgi:hypothetical protein